MATTMELTQEQQATCQDTEQSPKSTINDLPNELLVEISDFYQRDVKESYYRWSMRLGWFRLIHVCRRWRIVVLVILLFGLALRVKTQNKRQCEDHHVTSFPSPTN